jgi:hypothetical protein
VKARSTAASSVAQRTEDVPRLAGEKNFILVWIFLASRIIFRILHDANSLQVCAG